MSDKLEQGQAMHLAVAIRAYDLIAAAERADRGGVVSRMEVQQPVGIRRLARETKGRRRHA